MVDFKKLVTKERPINVRNLSALFESLDRHASHTELRPAQQEAVTLLSERRSDQDIILKVSTGAGKTVVGLIYLLSFMEELKRPVVYLCPTRQLVEQVDAEAERLGIKTVIYPAGESHPHIDGVSAKAVIVCTYDKLFNAKTTFDRQDVLLRPVAFVLDDAHAGLEEIRDAFTLKVITGELRDKLLEILAERCASFKPTVWHDIENGDPNATLEVPFWVWKPLIPIIQKALIEHAHDENHQFVLPYLVDVLKLCRCVVSGTGIEIAPDIVPIHKSQAFVSAQHRLFMSATLADDSLLVRELACSESAAHNPVIPASDRGLGERMVIAPSLVDKTLDRGFVMKLCKTLATKLNVVVLTPSEIRAKEWDAVGAQVYLRDSVNDAIEELKNPKGKLKFAMFVQRYDGLDLPDNACRVLVLDGLPVGEGIIDRHDSSLLSNAGGVRSRIVYRIEQGMGRAVRSHADYAVIILAGPELAHFIAKHEVLGRMNPDTRSQVKLAVDLAKLAGEESGDQPHKAVMDMINQCLNRDEGWKQFYNDRIRGNGKQLPSKTSDERIAIAIAERLAFESALAQDAQKATTILRSGITENVHDENEVGWYLQRVANYLFEVSPADGLEVQRAAYEKNRSVICPPGVVRRPVITGKHIVQENVATWYRQYENPNGAIAYLEDLKTKLSYTASPGVIEQAICDLAALLGADGTRPEQEYGEGPDDLWLWGEKSYVIEAKTGNEDTHHKKDAGQLVLSINWFRQNYATRRESTPLVVAKVFESDLHSGFPADTRVLLPDGMHKLLEALGRLFQALASRNVDPGNIKALAQLQQSLGLLPEQFENGYTVPLKERRR